MKGSFQAIREAIKDLLDAKGVPGLEVYTTYPAADELMTPSVMVGYPESFEYALTFGANVMQFNIGLTIFAAVADRESADLSIDELIQPYGPSSLKEAIYEDCTLKGTADDCVISEVRNFGELVTKSNAVYLTAEPIITILVTAE